MRARGRRRNGPSPHRSHPLLLMLSIRSRRPARAVVLAGLGLACLVVCAGAQQALGSSHYAARVLGRQGTAAVGAQRAATRTAAHATFVGGTYVAANGASVTVRVSDAFPDGSDRGRRWAEFFSTMPHGAELSTVTVTVVTAAELPASCNSDALGCYRPGEITIADEVLGGVTPEEVARHEYGHHVAASRLNSPWPALDWGPKRWATVAHVCGDVTVGSAHPGDESDHYSENPAEAWAEVYRILAERAAGLPGNTWSIVVGRYFPDDAALAAAREDVVHPWTAPTTRRFNGTFTKTGKRQWLRTLATPLDGTVTIKLSMPRGTRHDVTLLAANGRTVLARWTAFTSTTRTITTTVCGQRSVVLRVTRGNQPSPFSVAVTSA